MTKFSNVEVKEKKQFSEISLRANYPEGVQLEGHTCRMEILGSHHAKGLWEAYSKGSLQKNWTYLTVGPFTNFDNYEEWLNSVVGKSDPMFYAIVDKRTDKPVGVADFMSIDPVSGTIELGHLNFSTLMQKTIMSSEVIILMMRHAVSLGYIKIAWRCHSLNAASRTSAARYGFRFEAFFKNYCVVRGRNRNTCWYAITMDTWPRVDEVFTKWLDAALTGKYLSLSKMMTQVTDSYDAQSDALWRIFSDEFQNRLKRFPELIDEAHQDNDGAPLGVEVPGWTIPKPLSLNGLVVSGLRIDTLDPAAHSKALWRLFSQADASDWLYTSYGPLNDLAVFENWLDDLVTDNQTLPMVVTDLEQGTLIGTASYVSMKPSLGSVSIGHFNMIARKTMHVTETFKKLAQCAFEAGYRRVEWNCDTLDVKSINFAKSHGFSYEGTFKNCKVVNGRSCDFAWFSITDDEWPDINMVLSKRIYQLNESNENDGIFKTGNSS